MPWLLEMEFTREQAAAIRLAGVHEGVVRWWYVKESAAKEFPSSWLPRYGRVAVRLGVTDKSGEQRVEEHPVGLPSPIPHHDKSPEEFAKPVISGLVQATVRYVAGKPDFLPIECLHSPETRQAVDRYLEGCSSGEIKRWLRGVGDLEFIEDVSFGGEEVFKYRFVSRSGYDTIVDIGGGAGGLHIVY